MKTFPYELTKEFQKEAIHIIHFVTIIATNTYRWTDCDQDIYSSNWYKSKGLKFSPSTPSINSEIEAIELEIDNVDKFISNLVLSENMRGKEFTLYRALLDDSNHIVGETIFLFAGYTDEIKITKKRGNIKVFNEMIKWKTLTPRRIYSPTCQWIFTGIECAYAGSQVACDYTKDRCKELGNYDNFGGFYYIFDMAQKEIWWGSKPKLW